MQKSLGTTNLDYSVYWEDFLASELHDPIYVLGQ